MEKGLRLFEMALGLLNRLPGDLDKLLGREEGIIGLFDIKHCFLPDPIRVPFI